MANRKKSSTHKKQKVYKMKGCSRKNYLGGSTNNLVSSSSTNTIDISKSYPNMGPNPSGFNFLNPQTQTGGCGGGGTCGLTNPMMGGGRHRKACKCSKCRSNQKGGSGNNGIPYPNGLVGSAWTPSISSWPGVNGVSGDSNYLKLNTYSPVDISRQMVSVGAQPPFLGGKRRGTRKNRKGQKAGGLSNFLYQDLLNLGRQFQFGVGTTYNALRGYESPTNPLPWKGQLSSSNSSNLTRLLK